MWLMKMVVANHSDYIKEVQVIQDRPPMEFSIIFRAKNGLRNFAAEAKPPLSKVRGYTLPEATHLQMLPGKDAP